MRLAQTQTQQLGHWLLHVPFNMLLEQAAHSLSPITVLAGPVRDLRAIAASAIEIAPGLPFFPPTTVSLAC